MSCSRKICIVKLNDCVLSYASFFPGLECYICCAMFFNHNFLIAMIEEFSKITFCMLEVIYIFNKLY